MLYYTNQIKLLPLNQNWSLIETQYDVLPIELKLPKCPPKDLFSNKDIYF
jgi:hypothetical protein